MKLKPHKLILQHILKSITTVFYYSTVEVCMGVGIPTGMGFPRESHGNGNSRVDYDGNGMGMGVKAVGMGIAYISCL